MSYKTCAVPYCTNTSIKTSGKMFVCIPRNTQMRRNWLLLARRNPNDLAASTNAFMCEDHFDVERDTKNYMEYKIMNLQENQKTILRLKKGIVPHKFQYQKDRESQPPLVREGLEMIDTTLSAPPAKMSMERDMTNYRQYKMGFSKTILLAKGTLPSKFDCQADAKKRRPKKKSRKAYKCLMTDFDQETQVLLNTPATSALNDVNLSETDVESIGLPANKETKTVKKPRHESKTQTKSKSQAKDQSKTSKVISSTTFRVYSDSTKPANGRIPTLCIQPFSSDDVAKNPHHVLGPDEMYTEALIPKSCSDDFKAGVESVISKVYKFFKQEYSYLVKKYGDSIDLKPFLEYKERTAAATGATLVTVDRIIQDTTGRKPRKKRKLVKNKASCDVETSATDSCDEVRSEEGGNNECDEMVSKQGEDFSCEPETVEDEVWCGMPATSTAETDPIQVVVKVEPGDDEENSHTPNDDALPPKLEQTDRYDDDYTYGALDGEAVFHIEKIEFTEEEFT